MRKLLFLALFLILLQPLFSSVTYPEGLPGEEREFLDMAFFEAVDGRKDVPIMVTGYELGDDRGVLSFSIEGKEFSISARDRDEMVRFLSNALYAEPLLFLDGDVVDYVYEGISSSLGSYGYGDMFYIKDRDGRVRGVAQGKGDGELTILKTFYEKELKPGLSLSKGPSWALSFSLSSPFLRLSFDASVALRYLSLVRNFYPYVLFDVVYDRGVLKYYGCEGVNQHTIAQVTGTDALRGTSVAAMGEALKKAGSRFGITLKERYECEVDSMRELEKIIQRYNSTAKRMKRKKIRVISDSRYVYVGRTFAQMELPVYRAYRMKYEQREFREFKRDIHDRIDKGMPLVWCVILGVIPDKSAPQAAGGHMRLIIGYNDRTGEVIYSDTWGAAHEFKTMSYEDAWTITTRTMYINPRASR